MKTLMVDLTDDELHEVRNAIRNRIENGRWKGDQPKALLQSASQKLIKAKRQASSKRIPHFGKVT